MGGCTNCSGKKGCDTRKTAMFGELDEAIEALYPTRNWNECTVPAIVPSGERLTALYDLSDALSEVLRAPSWVKLGDESELADFIYILCVGREPSIGQVRDVLGYVPEAMLAEAPLLPSDQVLRVAVSRLWPLAAVQQVQMDMALDPMPHDGFASFTVREMPRSGVFDPVFLPRMQKLVSVIREQGLRHVDFGEITSAPQNFLGGDFEEGFGEAPALANYLFLAEPITQNTISQHELRLAPESIAS